MKKGLNRRLIVFFTALTFVLTAVVVIGWEQVLRPPFYAWVDRRYPGEANAEWRNQTQQRVEHFFISMTVDLVVVGILLAMVGRQQRRLVESEERYRALFEHANDGIGVVRSSDFRLIEANGKFCEALECDPRGLTGRDVRELLRPRPAGDDGDGRRNGGGRTPGALTTKDIAGLLAESDAGEAELMLETSAGNARPVAVSFSTITANTERLVILLVRDLSTRRRLEGEREEMQRQLFQSAKLASLGELSAGVAHEINNPLNGIINFAQLLKDEDRPRTDFERQMIDGIIDEGGRIAQIVRGLLTFARRDENELRHVHLADIIRASISLFGRQLEKDGVRVQIDLPADLPPVRADASRLRQVVVNMISNAHHALKSRPAGDAREGKLFRISARRVGADAGVGVGVGDSGPRAASAVSVEFYDNGVGIPAEALPRVFDPFFTTRRDAGGTGLGLSLSFGIVRDHGGTITVESEQGRYTCFRVELPAVDGWESEYA